jgi:hypothetical protein
VYDHTLFAIIKLAFMNLHYLIFQAHWMVTLTWVYMLIYKFYLVLS